MDDAKLLEMRSRVAKLLPYRRNPRPVQPDSFPPFVELELQRAAEASNNALKVLQDLDERLAALGG